MALPRKPKSAAQLATEAKMRRYASLPNGGKSAAQMATEAKMRAQAQQRGSSPAAQPKTDPAAAELAKVREYYAKNGHLPTLFAAESKRLFGDASSADVGGLGKQVALGKMSKDQALQQIRGGTSGLDPEAKRAGLAASVEIDPQVAAFETRRKQTAEGFERTNKQAQQTTQRTVAEQQEIYRRLAESLGLMQPKVTQAYDQGMTGVKGAYANLQKSLESNYGGGVAATNAEAARLGLQAAAPEATARMTADSAYLRGIAGVQEQGQLGTMSNLRDGTLADLLRGQSNASIEGSALSASTLREFSQKSAEERFRQQQEIQALQDQATALEATRTGRVFEGRQALEGQAAQAAYEQEQDAIANAIAQQKANAQAALAGVDQYKAETDRTYKLGQLGVAQADSMTKAEIARATVNKSNAEKQKILNEMTPGTPAYEKLAADIRLKNNQAAKAVSDAAVNQQNANTKAAAAEAKAKSDAAKLKADSAKQGKGLSGANTYLNNTLGERGGIATGQLVNQAYSKYPPSGDKNKNAANYRQAIKMARGVIQKQTRDQKYHNAVDAALAIAYGF